MGDAVGLLVGGWLIAALLELVDPLAVESGGAWVQDWRRVSLLELGDPRLGEAPEIGGWRRGWRGDGASRIKVSIISCSLSNVS